MSATPATAYPDKDTKRGRFSRRQLVIATIVALSVGCEVVWQTVVKDHVIVRNFGVVDEGKIYRSGRLTTATLTKVHDNQGIKTVIDFGAFLHGSEQDLLEEETAKRLGMKRVVLSLYGDGTGNPNAYVEALKIMSDPVNQPVLVHCSAGAQRTGVAVILYRSLFENVPIETAYEESQQYKHDSSRNKAMLQYVLLWHKQIAAAVKDGKLIPGIPPARADTPASAPDIASGRNE